MSDDLCIHELTPAQCSICNGRAHGPDPRAVAGGLKAAASRAGRTALPTARFEDEIDRAVECLRSAGDTITTSAVQRLLRGSGYEAGRRPTQAALRARGLVE